MNSSQVSGHALVGEDLDFRPVEIIVEDGQITAIEENRKAAGSWICPAFFNAHTHLGDTVALDARADGTLSSLVTPPHGLKHRILSRTPRRNLVAGMRASIGSMIEGGTCGCADFREGGPAGVLALREAAGSLPFHPLIFGRDGGEGMADGLGISSTRDVPDSAARAEEARRAGKKIAIHAGERDAGDVDQAIALDPDLLVHCTHATRRQLRECADRGIPIAICPRSNWILGVTSSARHPPVRTMLDLGCSIRLGTDNAMFVSPDLFAEMAFCSTVYGVDPKVLLDAAIRGSDLTGSPFFIRNGARAAFFLIDTAASPLRFSRDPIASIVKRGSCTRIGSRVFNSNVK